MRLALSKRRQGGFTWTDLIVLMTMVIVPCVVVALGQMTRCSGRKPPRVRCTSNLKQAALAFILWSADNAGTGSARYPVDLHQVLGTSNRLANNSQMRETFLAISDQLRTPVVLVCPGEKKRKAAESFKKLTTQNMSYFLAVDLNEANANQILLGDRGLALSETQAAPGWLQIRDSAAISWAGEIHGRKDGNGGNVALIDGSAHQVTSCQLRELILQNGFGTNNRVLIP